MKKILLTGAKGMLGTDFIAHFGDRFDIFPLDRNNGDVTDMDMMDTLIQDKKPDIILNFAAYTNVEDAEDLGMKGNFDVNTLGTYNLAKISAKYAIDFITISTDYVFDGVQEGGYTENDECNPINSYGMAKYLGEKLAKQENPNSIIIRTSWLYGGGKGYKNFVNTMLTLSETKKELKVVNDQFGCPTYTVDLCEGIAKVIEDIESYTGKILHFCNQTEPRIGARGRFHGISWFDFAQQIFKVSGEEIELLPCSSDEFITTPLKSVQVAKRPKRSKLVNTSPVQLRDWKEGLGAYLRSIHE